MVYLDLGNLIGLFVVFVFVGMYVLMNELYLDIVVFIYGKSVGKVVGVVFEASFST